MSVEPEVGVAWSHSLASDLLAGTKRDLLRNIDPHSDCSQADEWRCDLARRSLSDPVLQSTIVRGWRESHEDVVAAAHLLSPEVSRTHLNSLLQHFGGKDLLLEQLTDPTDGGETPVRWFVDNVEDAQVRKELTEILDAWFEDEAESRSPAISSRQTVRIVIFGGHVRDARKMHERLFQESPFDVQWKPFEKGGTSQTTKAVNEAMTQTDAVLLVTSMVSHTLMGIVKRQSRVNDIPFRTIPKATDMHLTQVLGDLFPDLIKHATA